MEDHAIIQLMSGTILPIFICCVLPVSIVLIVFIFKNKALARKTDILKLTIEKGAQVDPESLMEALAATGHSRKSVRQQLLNRLTAGCVLLIVGLVAAISVLCIPKETIIPDAKAFFVSLMSVICAIGVGFLVSFLVGKRMLKPEIEMEEQYVKHSVSGCHGAGPVRTGNAEARGDAPVSANVESAGRSDGAGK